MIGLGNAVRAAVEHGLRAHGLTLRHFSASGHLSSEPGLSYSELARRADVTAQRMQATLLTAFVGARRRLAGKDTG